MADKKYLQQLQKDFEKFQNAPKYSLDSEELFCVCRKPDNGELMVACDGCDEWFHFKCMKIDKKYKNLVNNYYCLFCDDLFNKGKSIWKKKCKLSLCYEPIDGESQFCCLDHGNKYWREFLEKFDNTNNEYTNINNNEIISKSQIENLIQSVNIKDELLEIGNHFPVFDKNELIVTPEQQLEINDNINSIKILQLDIENLTFKLNYLSKLKDIISHLNEFLSLSLDPKIEITELENNSKDTSKKRKNSKLNKKQKKFKVDLCGFDRRLSLNNKEWIEFTKSNDVKQITDFNTISKENETVFKNTYENMKKYIEGGDDTINIKSDNILSNFCISDKRKCHLHNGWFNIMKDGLELKINENIAQVEKMSKDNEKLQQFIQIKNWKIYCDEI
ncbi:hypothetical protein C6P40_000809 [Pichia californica]|uniref:PHD-type domain-containing protein n=1 Tax=Pichia californica TaxID=460514 RepID=A0A9P6WKJ1_9ASCO|nr:hypothetical protein C6P40_000809 [[Candida] californica]